jgi:hypothetical protein
VLETTQCNLNLCFQLPEAEEVTTPSEGPQMTIVAIYFYNVAISHEHEEFRFYAEILFKNKGLLLNRDWFLPQCKQAREAPDVTYE